MRHRSTTGVGLAAVLLPGLASAVHRASTQHRRLQRRVAAAEALLALDASLAARTEPKALAHELLRWGAAWTGAARGVVLAGPEGQLLLLARQGLEHQPPPRARPVPGPVLLGLLAADGACVTGAVDPGQEPWLAELLPGATGLVVVPLRVERRALGLLVLARGGPAPAPDDLRALEHAAAQTAGRLGSAWLVEQVRRLAATDGLTKIPNRRTFESTLEREVARASRNDEPVSLVMLDIDHFKALNDTYGHPEGDEVLRNVALALACECRDFDTAARYGGEEFAVVLPGAGVQESGEIAERLRLSVSAAPSRVGVTASAGVATFPTHAADADALVRAADRALYRSKAAGRDRTTGAGTQEEQVEVLLRAAVPGHPPTVSG